MTRHSIRFPWAALFGVGLLAASLASADPMPPTVTYTVTGSANDWTLDFTVDNNTNQNLYFFGVLLPATDETGAPNASWCTFPNPPCGSDTPWNNSGDGGSSISYNNVWLSEFGTIPPGTSLGGFTALDLTDAVAPSSVDWFAYTDAFYTIGTPPYTGGGNFGGEYNPGFEGIASETSAVPEPTPTSLLLLLILGVGLAAKWKRSPDGSAALE